MKMPLVAAAAVLGGASVVGVTSLFAQRPAAPASAAGGIAIIEMSVITKDSNRFKQAMEGLKAEYDAKAEELRREGERGNQLTEQLRRLPAGSPERKKLEEDVIKLRTEFDLHGRRAKESTLESETKIIHELMQEVKGEMTRYAQANNLKLILRHDPSPPELTDSRAIMGEIQKPIVYARLPVATPPILETMNRRTPAAAPTARTNPATRPAQR